MLTGAVHKTCVQVTQNWCVTSPWYAPRLYVRLQQLPRTPHWCGVLQMAVGVGVIVTYDWYS